MKYQVYHIAGKELIALRLTHPRAAWPWYGPAHAPAITVSALRVFELPLFVNQENGYRSAQILFQTDKEFYSLHRNRECLKNFRCRGKYSQTTQWSRQGRDSLNKNLLNSRVTLERRIKAPDKIYSFLQNLNW